jgi:hypothetical protein
MKNMADGQVETLLLRHLVHQRETSLAFADGCENLELEPLALNRYRASFMCETLLETAERVRKRPTKVVTEIWFPRTYLRRVDSMQIISVLEPLNIFLPNVRPPAICIGKLNPGAPLVEIISRVWEVLAGQNVMPNEFDALNAAACSWIRNNPECLPLDPRSLKGAASPVSSSVSPASVSAKPVSTKPRAAALPDGSSEQGGGWEVV